VTELLPFLSLWCDWARLPGQRLLGIASLDYVKLSEPDNLARAIAGSGTIIAPSWHRMFHGKTRLASNPPSHPTFPHPSKLVGFRGFLSHNWILTVF
jgi:hypothetical protein